MLRTLLLVGVLLAVSCTGHDDAGSPSVSGGEENTLKLMIEVPGSEMGTRASSRPQGGENGDGEEAAVRNEDKIYDLTAFAISDAEGILAEPSTTIKAKAYIDYTSSDWETVAGGVKVALKLKDFDVSADDKVVVVVNAGDLRSAVTTVGELRDYKPVVSFAGGSIAGTEMFVMSSAGSDDGTVALGGSGDMEAHVKVQRLAARIDFMFHDGYNLAGSSSELKYDVTTSDRSPVDLATLHLKNIIPVNVMQKPSYITKRVTADADVSSAVTYYGSETADANHIPTNYVIEPHTLLKESTVAGATLTEWYGSTRAATVMGNTSSYLANTGISSYLPTKTARSELGYYTHHVTISYANENTQSCTQHKPEFLTGLLLRCIYEPKMVYTDAAASKEYTKMSDYASGKTFWRYSPTKTEMNEADCLYFSNENAANDYRSAHPSEQAEITMFVGGVCYYTVWLRHANKEADPHETFPMEYGIVRNNIYRVGVKKFTGPGTPNPSFENPDHAQLRIFVRPWYRRENSEIIL